MSVVPIQPYYHGSSDAGAARALVAIAGTVFSPASVDVAANNYSASDTATITLAMQGQYQSRNYGNNLASIDFGAATETGNSYIVAVYIGYPSDPTPGAYSTRDLVLQFSGIVDTFDWSYLKDEVSISCRSFAALFLNTKTTAQWNNQSTTSVVAELAKRHGLSTSINVSSPGQMSAVYARDFVTGTQNMDEWSLLQAMAQYDHAECFVRGTTLYYRTFLQSSQANKVTLDWEKNLIDVEVQHSPQFSQLIKVNVKAWAPLTRTGTHSSYSAYSGMPIAGTLRTGVSSSTYSPVFGTRTSQSSNSSGQSVDGIPIQQSSGTSSSTVTGGAFSSGFTSMPKGPSALEYTYHYPGIDRATADALAQKIWIQLSAHLFHLTSHAAVTPDVQALLNQDTIFHLNGPVPSHNLDYNVRRISQSFAVSQEETGMPGGWTYSVDGVNLPIVEQTI